MVISWSCSTTYDDTLRPRQNGPYCSNDISKLISVIEHGCSLKKNHHINMIRKWQYTNIDPDYGFVQTVWKNIIWNNDYIAYWHSDCNYSLSSTSKRKYIIVFIWCKFAWCVVHWNIINAIVNEHVISLSSLFPKIKINRTGQRVLRGNILLCQNLEPVARPVPDTYSSKSSLKLHVSSLYQISSFIKMWYEYY